MAGVKNNSERREQAFACTHPSGFQERILNVRNMP